jgi:hypothetical protein
MNLATVHETGRSAVVNDCGICESASTDITVRFQVGMVNSLFAIEWEIVPHADPRVILQREGVCYLLHLRIFGGYIVGPSGVDENSERRQ